MVAKQIKCKNYKLLKDIINKYDPLGLIDLDTPESLSEYDPELREIFKKDIHKLNGDELGELIYSVFLEFFDNKLVNDKQIYLNIADEFVKSTRG